MFRFSGKKLVTVYKNQLSSSVRKMSGLKGKVAVITASTDGIGYGIAEKFGAEGAKVIISSRKEKNVKAAVEKLKANGACVEGTVCHVANAEDRKKLFKMAEKTFGGVDILVSNAAVNPAVGPVLDCDEVAWDKIFDVNVKCSYLLAKEALPYIRARGGGSIIFVSSIAGFQPFALLGAYSVSKTALFGLTKAAALDVAHENIRVNCIAPGIVQTKFAAALVESEAAREEALAKIPMNRLGTPSDIAGVATFLASDDAKFITGETIVAAGGMASRL